MGSIVSLSNRIERLEQAAAIGESAGVPPEIFRKVLATIQRDETAIDLLRQAALVEDSQRWWLPPDASQEFRDIIDGICVEGIERSQAVVRLRAEMHARMRRTVARELGEDVAVQCFDEPPAQDAI